MAKKTGIEWQTQDGIDAFMHAMRSQGLPAWSMNLPPLSTPSRTARAKKKQKRKTAKASRKRGRK